MAIYTLCCIRCNGNFETKSHPHQKYCSQKCYRSVPISDSYREKMRNLAIKNGNIPPHRKSKDHYRWIKDRNLVVGINNRAFHDPESKQWRRSVLERDGFRCKISNEDCLGKIEAHHILGWKSHPELRYQINNGITLCHFHHPRRREDEKRLTPYFKELVAGQM